MLAGNLIGGLAYSRFQNLKTALYNQTKRLQTQDSYSV